jgi:alpha-amylase/alpha-mannosidase (GH57 family)
MATDEGILAKSGIDLSWDNRRRLYHPYQRGDMKIFFRDRAISDLIGFQYMHAPPPTVQQTSFDASRLRLTVPMSLLR